MAPHRPLSPYHCHQRGPLTNSRLSRPRQQQNVCSSRSCGHGETGAQCCTSCSQSSSGYRPSYSENSCCSSNCYRNDGRKFNNCTTTCHRQQLSRVAATTSDTCERSNSDDCQTNSSICYKHRSEVTERVPTCNKKCLKARNFTYTSSSSSSSSAGRQLVRALLALCVINDIMLLSCLPRAVLLVAATSVSLLQPGNVVVRACEPITVEKCKNIGYNVTTGQNLVGNENQQDAEVQLNTFGPLIQFRCSSQLQFFLCSVYVPMCTEKVLEPIGPCRGLCLNVMNKCRPVLHTFGYQWPHFLNCSKFPERNDHKHMCMEGPSVEEPDPPALPQGGGGEEEGGGRPGSDAHASGSSGHQQHTNPSSEKCAKLTHPTRYAYINRTGTCLLRCNESVILTPGDKQTADAWLTVLSIISLLLTLFTLLTYVIDSTRFHYPEKPVVMMSFCYCAYSLTIIIRLVAGREAFTCVTARTTGTGNAETVVAVVPDDGMQNSGCAATFVVLYYASVAGALWWLVLAINWFLAAGFKWSREALEAKKFVFHVVAWSVPGVLTVAALVSHSVEVDELTGVCLAGAHSRSALLAFVIVPLSVVLLVGVSFLLAGLVAMCQIRRDVRSIGERSESFERHMRRVGAFSVMYTIPAACQLACHAYEYANRDAILGRNSGNNHDLDFGQEVKVISMRIIASLALGISAGLWACSRKTLATWGTACGRLCNGQRAAGGGVAHKVVTSPSIVCSSSNGDSCSRPVTAGCALADACPPVNRRYLPIHSVSSSGGSVPRISALKDPLTGMYLPPTSSGYRSLSGRTGGSKPPGVHRGVSSHRTSTSPSPPGNFYHLTSSVDDDLYVGVKVPSS